MLTLEMFLLTPNNIAFRYIGIANSLSMAAESRKSYRLGYQIQIVVSGR